ncbi:MAG: peptide-methionine (S)-S-oxide reductase MsrA [Clostridia bacterium]|nr:peptide-methionine (S)-S-oxide reductase MsrA [Clostridia bacterium]
MTTANQRTKDRVIYLAGGCFWGLEKLMRSLPGVTQAMAGYANGSTKDPTYREVCSGSTGHREAVRVDYDPAQISLDAILFAFFRVIDPGLENAQGHDIGAQYQSGVYYADEEARQTVERIAAIERERAAEFKVEIKALACFYPAEEYHQQYLDKNPGGYCHISPEAIRRLSRMIVDPGRYPRPDREILRQQLSPLEFSVTQEAATEAPFDNPFWQHFEPGVYVDIAGGEPLFSSRDKYHCSCGWPGFTRPIDENTMIYLEDNTLSRRRVEVRSRAANSHLGHIFTDDPESPNGVRYCIDSAALRFIPYEEMEGAGYGYLKSYVK